MGKPDSTRNRNEGRKPLFIDTPSGVTQTDSETLGWPILILSYAEMPALRRRLRQNPHAMRLTCIVGLEHRQLHNAGINFVATGPNETTVSTPITFSVGRGAAGQL